MKCMEKEACVCFFLTGLKLRSLFALLFGDLEAELLTCDIQLLALELLPVMWCLPFFYQELDETCLVGGTTE